MSDDELKDTADARLGRILRGKYRLDRVLGIGGMATVYAATHRNKKRFAIKMLHPELSIREQIRTRFLREGYVANSVDHPGAVAVLDDDVAEDGSAFLVMELLEGSPVDTVAATTGHKMPLGLVLSIGDALLDVLVAAHAKGIVHRDLKPANLFLTNDGRLEVLDFGIARLHDETSASATQTGAVLGTPAYMAPEQAMAESSRIDGQTDLWAVGATMFALLTGTLVHEGVNASQLLVFAATRKARPVESVAVSVPRGVAQVINRALAFDKGERWGTAREMREALARACVEDTGAPIAPLPKTERLTGLEATMAPSGDFGFPSGAGSGRGSDAGSGPRSSGVGFEPTVDALEATQAPGEAVASGLAASTPVASGGAPIGPATTGVGVVATQPSVVAPRVARAVPWRKLATAGGVLVVLAAVAGGVAMARRPRVTYCADFAWAVDGLRCVTPIPPEAVAKRWTASFRFTTGGGGSDHVERVTFAGTRIRVIDTDAEVLRNADGSVREIVMRDPHRNVVEWQKWSDGGRRVDFVDTDGATPAHHVDQDGTEGRYTTLMREFDPRGFVSREVYLGPTGRPRPSGAEDHRRSFGEIHASGRAGRPVRVQFLAADGKPGADSTGVGVFEWSDDETPDGLDLRVLDVEGQAVCDEEGIHHLRREYSAAFDTMAIRNFGLKDEPTALSSTGTHGVDLKWDPAARANEQITIDEQGHPRPLKGNVGSIFRTVYDERGRRVLFETLDANRNLVIFAHDAVRTRRRFDANDNDVELTEFDASDAPMLDKDGIARRVSVFDEHGRPLEKRFFDTAGRPTIARDAGALVKFEYDARGLETSRAFFDADGHPLAGTHGYASYRVKYDRLRNPVEKAFFGADGHPCTDDEGTGIVRHVYDANDDLVVLEYLDASGAPTMHGGQWATQRLVNDERGLVIEESYFDTHGEPALLREGYAKVTRLRDRNGDVVEEAYFGKRGEPVAPGGVARKKTAYDVRRRPTVISLFDAGGAATSGDEGWSIERIAYEDRGLVARRDHFDAAGKPAVTRRGASDTRTYDGRGNLLEEATLGVDGRPVAGDGGYATKKSTYDERDELIEEALFGADGKPTLGKDGWSVRKLAHDETGNLTEEAFFDGDHRPVTPKDVTYASVRSRFDARQHLLESSYFDATGAPAKGPDGAAIVRYQRDVYGRPSETAWFDGSATPAPSKDGKIVARAKYDEAGHLVDERFVDASGAPRAASDGCAGHHTKVDAQGRTLEESCLDAKDAPTLSADGWAIRRTLRDARGNAVDVSTFGPGGERLADKDGIARRRNRYDERNLLLETTYFDAGDKPVHDKQGGYALRCSYDDSGKKMGEMAVDAAGGVMGNAMGSAGAKKSPKG